MVSVLVMCDGGRSSTRALQLAVCPGLILSDHVGAQVVVNHVWERKQPSSATRNAEKERWATSPTASVKPTSPKPTPARAATGSMLPPSASMQPASRAAPAHATTSSDAHTLPDTDAGNDLPSPDHAHESPSAVMDTVLSLLYSSKVTRDTLNYALETAELSQAVTAHSMTPTYTAEAHTHRRGEEGNKGESSATEEESDAGNNKGNGHDEQSQNQQPQQQRRADAIVRYAQSRMTAHEARVILLGAGDAEQKGKWVRVGPVAKSAWRLLRARCVLYFVKADGPLCRPWYPASHVSNRAGSSRPAALGAAESTNPPSHAHTPGAIRYVVVVACVRAAGPERATKRAARGEQELAARIDKQREEKENTCAGSSSVGSAVRYALRQRRLGTGDTVMIVVVTEPRTTAAAAAAAAAAEADSVSVGNDEQDDVAAVQRATEALWLREFSESERCEPDSADGSPASRESLLAMRNKEGDGAGEVSSEDDDNEHDDANGESESAAAEAMTSSGPPEVRRCVLRATKHLPEPSVCNAGTAQVVKFLQSCKPDYIVTPCSTVTPLQEALLAMPKSHCIVVPEE